MCPVADIGIYAFRAWTLVSYSTYIGIEWNKWESTANYKTATTAYEIYKLDNAC